MKGGVIKEELDKSGRISRGMTSFRRKLRNAIRQEKTPKQLNFRKSLIWLSGCIMRNEKMRSLKSSLRTLLIGVKIIVFFYMARGQ